MANSGPNVPPNAKSARKPKVHLTSLRLRRIDWYAMQQHAQSETSQEVCGFIAGSKNRSAGIFPVKNIAPGRDYFQMDGQEQVEALLKIESRGWNLLGIYHSHIDGISPWPSNIDCGEHYPEAAMVIWTPDCGSWSCRAFRLNEHREAEEIPVQLLLK